MNETNVEQLNQDLIEDQNTCEEEVYNQTSEPESKSGSKAIGYLTAMLAALSLSCSKTYFGDLFI